MDRREFFEQGGAIAAATMLLGAVDAAAARATEQEAAAPAPQAFRLLGAPVLQNVGEDGVTVSWAVSGSSTGWVEYGESPDTLNQKALGGDGGLFPLETLAHRVRLNGLKPGKRYHYRIGCSPVDFKDAYHIQRAEPVYSPVYSFQTLNGASADSISFSVINDTHEKKATMGQLLPLLKAGETDFTFWNGDLFDDIRSEAQIADRFLYPAEGIPYAAQSPLFVVRGNHDVRGVAARMLGRFIDTPDDRYYYSFRQGPVAFIILDTGEDKEDTHPVYAGLNDFAAYRQEQRQWLEKEVRRDSFRSAPFRVVLTHIPLFGANCPGQKDSQEKWHDVLAKAKVDLVISGHTHRCTYHAPQEGRPYPILIGGGPNPDQATLIRAQADRKELKVTMQKLDGSVVGTYTYTKR